MPDNEQKQQTEAATTHEERLKLFLGDLAAKCETYEIKVAAAIVVDPLSPGKPLIFYRGEIYDLTKNVCNLARFLKQQILKDINV